MMTSDTSPREAFVWVWLPGAAQPVVAGRIEGQGRSFPFTYGKSYLGRSDAIALYRPELPLKSGRQQPLVGLDIAGCLADGGPDSWGRRVILARHLGHLDSMTDTGELSPLSYFLQSGSNRIGGLDFQSSSDEYIPRSPDHQATTEDLAQASERIQAGEPLAADLGEALVRGASIGGARPKAILFDEVRGLEVIAKFSMTNDVYPAIQAEAVAMELGRRVGLNVAATRVTQAAGRYTLLVDRFDRTVGGGRKIMVSALTMLGLNEMIAPRSSSYVVFADLMRRNFKGGGAARRELFRRIVFNIAVGNTDDHARNHAAFWDGNHLEMTPAYDIAPQIRSGNDVNQAMTISRSGDRRSRFSTCIAAAGEYGLGPAEAIDIVDHVKQVVNDEWDDAADVTELSSLVRQQLWTRSILNPSIEWEWD
ncbi:serine/threonine-protein kinase HipA [Rhodoglobus vestalii]|uniref:Serine/threonine-protein kinase HipA n=2 Tax=Rhodoglobus vestalii TaxID=193384 RepID=A0A8H2K8I9_9MICO|nr:serine/threonine-protein kinase HipA [Rhodoglobus vestalii]